MPFLCQLNHFVTSKLKSNLIRGSVHLKKNNGLWVDLMARTMGLCAIFIKKIMMVLAYMHESAIKNEDKV